MCSFLILSNRFSTLYRNGLKDGQFGDICHQEMTAIKKVGIQCDLPSCICFVLASSFWWFSASSLERLVPISWADMNCTSHALMQAWEWTTKVVSVFSFWGHSRICMALIIGMLTVLFYRYWSGSDWVQVLLPSFWWQGKVDFNLLNTWLAIIRKFCWTIILVDCRNSLAWPVIMLFMTRTIFRLVNFRL